VQQLLTPVAGGLASRNGLFKWIVAVSLALAALAAAASEKVQVTDPYIELRTGPGRGYPVFYVAERNEWIEIELRHTDWFKVRTQNGKEGWVNRKQLETTLTQIGTTTTFSDVVLGDYLHRRLELGAGYGHFKSDPMLKAWLSYNLVDTVAIEAVAGQVQGSFSGTDLWHVNLLVEPWSDWRLAPFLGVGIGRLNNFPNPSLVAGSTSNARLADATVGLRYHLGDRFIVRLDYTQYLAYISSSRTDQYRAATIGFGFFF
jgi:Bacterial SH3 domain